MGNACGGGSSKSTTTHIVSVRTGDKKGAGTDGNIFLSIADKSGNWSKEKLLDAHWRDDFERGNTDKFYLECPDIGDVEDICLRRDGSFPNDDWYVEKIEVVTCTTNSQATFPVLRWIRAKDQFKLAKFDMALPKFEKYSKQRAQELERKREVYQLVEMVPGAPKQIAQLPNDERFSHDYKWNIQTMKLKLFAQTTYINMTTPKFERLTDFDEIYRGALLPVPYGQFNWKSDEEFGNQRLSGCNTTMIELCREIPKGFSVSADMVEPFLEGQSMQEAMDKRKLYILDLTYMAHIECSRGRKLCGPYGLFYSNKSGNLVPVAIQLMPEPAEDNPVFLPSDPEYTWLAAKMWFNLSDCSHHQSVTHLGFTHLVMETVCICTHRQLSPSHPIYKLLAPHFLYLISINSLAVNKLVAPDGWVDETMHIGRTGMFNIIKHNWDKWNVKEFGNILYDLKRRGVDDVEALPNYHYRDDAILIWDALNKYVDTVVKGIYDVSDNLTTDFEVQGWAKELIDAGVKGVPSPITSIGELTELITTFIFMASVGHASANFCQYDEYAYPPNYPAQLIGERPKNKEPLTEDHLVKSLPDKKQTLNTMIVTKILSDRGTNELGNFEVQYAYDPLFLQALELFKEDLNVISNTVDARNVGRLRKYFYLNPREVPNAISI